MGVREKGAAFCQGVDVRREGLGVDAEAADPVVLVIDGNEEDVGPLRCGGLESQGGEEDEQAGFHG